MLQKIYQELMKEVIENKLKTYKLNFKITINLQKNKMHVVSKVYFYL